MKADFPYKDKFDEMLIRIRESGLVFKWRKDFYYSLIVDTLKRKYEPHEHNVYTMNELNFIFISLCISECLCSCIFVLEIIVHHWINKAHNK